METIPRFPPCEEILNPAAHLSAPNMGGSFGSLREGISRSEYPGRDSEVLDPGLSHPKKNFFLPQVVDPRMTTFGSSNKQIVCLNTPLVFHEYGQSTEHLGRKGPRLLSGKRR